MWNLFRKSLKSGTVTSAYPDRPEAAPTAFRGKPEINPDKCTGCMECVKVCPTEAFAAGQGYLELDLSRCLFCGLCQDVCAKKAVEMTGEYELAVRAKGDLRQFYCFQAPAPEADINFLGHQLENKIKKVLGRSLQIRHMDAGSCNGCDWELSCLLNPVYDIQRFGFDFVASPRHADLLLCTGPVTRHLEVALRRTYLAAPSPKLVAAAGSCACSGGIYREGYGVVGGIDKVLPVDVYIPGCPPRPQALIYGLMVAVERMEQKIHGKNAIKQV